MMLVEFNFTVFRRVYIGCDWSDTSWTSNYDIRHKAQRTYL